MLPKRKLCLTAFVGTLAINLFAQQNLSNVRTLGAKKPIANEVDIVSSLRTPQEVSRATAYFDGFGRMVQTVTKQSSPLQKDVVVMRVFDNWGREVQQYLPFVSNVAQTGDITNDGNYKTDPLLQQTAFNQLQYPGENYFYSQTVFENSPLNRVLNSYPQGNSWVGSSRGSSVKSLVNTTPDNVQIWNISLTQGSLPVNAGAYPAGRLYKIISTDEKNVQTIEFRDKNGHVVLQKNQLTASADPGTGSGHSGWVCTYFVYDDYDNLRSVITPKVVGLIDGVWTVSQNLADELCYRFEYDPQNRLVIKKTPGADEEWFVYDQRDRLVMSQDGNLRNQHKWQYSQYDNLDRIIASGTITDAANYNNLNFHQSNAATSISYPNTASFAPVEVLTQIFYDNYNWVTGTGLPSSFDASNVSNTTYFYTPDNANFPYPQAIAQTAQTRGLTTGSKREVLGSGGSQYLYSVSYYNEKGRLIQEQETNITSGIDKITTQHSWSGLVLRELVEHGKGGINSQSHKLLSKMSYDHNDRLLNIKKTISSTIGSTTINNPEKTIAEYSYNELGQLKNKDLGVSSGLAVESQVYDYNIRGWLVGMNKNFTQAGNNANYFGFEVAYDKTNTANGTTSFTVPRYDGASTGVIWKSKGDGIPRKYDFNYDNTNRLSNAAFLQNTSSTTWDNSYINYSINNISYDLNGNIKTLNQNGFILGGGPTIDDLTYNYLNTDNSNKLMNVVDAANNASSRLGDFHYAGTKTSLAIDYVYDANGGQISDNNKNISSITYNLLNLPSVITVMGKGTITFTYDAVGNKVKKQTQENGAVVLYNGNNYTTDITTTTTYVGGFVYESKSYSHASLSALNSTESLQFVAHEEGRARIVYPLYGVPPYFAFDYFLRDHLGNIRVTLTDEQQQDTYPAATIETAGIGTEQSFYNIVNDANHVIPTSTLSWYPSVTGNTYQNNNGIPVPPDPTINPGGTSANLYKLNGATGDRFGLGITLKVMAGDVINIFGKSLWHDNGSGTDNTNYNITNVLSSFINAFAGTAAVMHGSEGTATGTLLNSNPVTTTNLSSLLSNPPTPSGQTPKAYINWILFDEQFKPVANGGGFDPINVSQNQIKPHSITGINIIKSGYLYVYCSNESNQDVYFDNVQVTQTRSRLIEERHFYPGGLAMFGLCSRGFGKLQNNFGYQGKQLQANEFYDHTGLELYDFQARYYDPQLMRWWVQDPVINFGSPYSGMANNPVSVVDPDGRNPWVVVAIVVSAIAGGYTGYRIAEANGYKPSDLKFWGYIFGGAAIGAASGYVGATIAAAGGFMSNTIGLIYSSSINSIGMTALSDGMIEPSISFGVASFDFGTGEWGWLGKKGNSFLANLGYAFGAMANLQDLFAGVHGMNGEMRAEADPESGVPHARFKGDYVTKAADGTDIHHEVDISVAENSADYAALGDACDIYKYCDAPGRAAPSNFANMMDYAQFWLRHVIGGEYYGTEAAVQMKVPLNNVNGNLLKQMSDNIQKTPAVGKWGIGKLKYGSTIWGCQSHVAQALWGVGVPTLPINFHPLVLATQLAIRQVGIYASPFLVDW